LRHKAVFISVAFLILSLMLVYPLSDLVPQNRSADTVASPTKERIQEAYGKLPVLFIENQGQLDSMVEYYIKTPAQTLYFTKDGIIFDLTRCDQAEASGMADSRAERLVFSLDFMGANREPTIKGTGKDSAVVNYLTGDNPGKWHTDIPTYREVVYHEIYPAIDLRLLGKGNVLEYDFTVRPGACPDDIALVYNGIDSLRIENGELVAGTAFGDIEQDRPYTYQQIGDEKIQVDGGFRLGSGNTYGFYVTAYDNRYPLIIDPMLAYSTYLGGSSGDFGYGIAVDASGSAYVTGQTNSSNFPTQNPYQETRAGNDDVFVAKLSAGGDSLVYSTYLGGSQGDYGRGIAVDSTGCAYVTGGTNSGNFPTQNPYQGTNAGNYDAFVARLSAAGTSLVYSTYLGGSHDDYGLGIAVDSAGCAYVVGFTYSSNFPTQNPYQGTNAGYFDAFVAKLSAAGDSLSYSTYLGGSQNDYGCGTAVDSAGDAYVTGYTYSSDFPTQKPYQETFAGFIDVFVARLSAVGNSLSYSTYLGGSSYDYGNGIAVDSADGAYVTGYTGSSDFPTQNPYQGTFAGIDDAFVARLSAAGNSLVYSTYLGGSYADFGYGIAVDASGGAYVTGYTGSSDFPTQTYQGTFAGGTDAFVARLSEAGSSLRYSTYLGGSGLDEGYGIAVDSAGGAYVTGYTGSSDFPTQNPYQEAKAGNYDVFVSKIPLPPSVTTDAATDVGVNSATLNMSFTLGEFDLVEVRFAYKSSADSTWRYTVLVPETAAGSYAETVTGLLPSAVFDFKAQVKFASIIIDGNTLQFTTGMLPAQHPKVSPPLPRTLNQAQMSVQYLNVSPQQANANQPVTITTNVVNTGDEAGSLNVALRINGQVEDTRMVSVGPKATQPVKFTVSRSQPGTYTVDIYDQNGSFTVLGSSNAAGKPVNGGLVILVAIAVLVLAAAVVLVLSFRRPA
jgi:hypothetical protein